jgi:hypothetical protein
MALKTFTTADGSANQALVTNGSGVLSFAAVGASAGQVIQVITATDQTPRTTSSSSFVTGSNTLSVTITPSAAANKIFVITQTTGASGDSSLTSTIFRGATNLGNGNAGIMFFSGGKSSPFSLSILDSPNTTSATTYQLYFRQSVSGTATINDDSPKASLTCFEIKG